MVIFGYCVILEVITLMKMPIADGYDGIGGIL